MFSQKKSILKGKSFYIVLAVILLCGVWLNYSILNKDSESEIADNNGQLKNNVEAAETNEVQDSQLITDKTKFTINIYDEKGSLAKSQNVMMPQGLLGMTMSQARDYLGSNYDEYKIKEITANSVVIYKVSSTDELMASAEVAKEDEGYYLIKADEEGEISIYHIDHLGNEEFVRTTDIYFDLLSTADQELFNFGIIKETQEELNELLQDFES